MKIRDYVFYVSLIGGIALTGLIAYETYHLGKGIQAVDKILLGEKKSMDKIKKEMKEKKSPLENSFDCL